MQLTERPESIPAKIVKILSTEPNKSAEELSLILQVKKPVLKVIIHKMTQRGQIIGERVQREVKTPQGPQKIYRYRLPTV